MEKSLVEETDEFFENLEIAMKEHFDKTGCTTDDPCHRCREKYAGAWYPFKG